MNLSPISYQPKVINFKGGEKTITKAALESVKTALDSSLVQKAIPTAGALAAMAGVAVVSNNSNTEKEVVNPVKVENAADLPGYEEALASIDETKTKVFVEKEHTSYTYDNFTEQETRYKFYDSDNKEVMTQIVTTYDSWRKSAYPKKAITIHYNDDKGFPVMADGMNGKITSAVTFNNNHKIINKKELVDGQLIDVNNKSVNGRGYTLYARNENGSVIMDHYNFEGDRNLYVRYSHSTPYTDNPNGYGIKEGDPSYNLYEAEMHKAQQAKQQLKEGIYVAYEKQTHSDGSYSLYAKDEKGNIIGDHYRNGVFSHSTPYKEDGYGIVECETTEEYKFNW